MVTVGLLIGIEAKPDRVADVEAALKSAVDRVREEDKAAVWFALRLGPTTFAIYDAFEDDEARQAHLKANEDALRAMGAQLFTEPPGIQHVDVVAGMIRGQ